MPLSSEPVELTVEAAEAGCRLDAFLAARFPDYSRVHLRRVISAGGVRVEGTFEGQIALKGLLVIGETGKITCDSVRAASVIVSGAVKGNIFAQKVEIRSTGRVWGDIVTTAFATEEGAFLRGQIRMEDAVDLGLDAVPVPVTPAAAPIDPANPELSKG